MAVYSRQKRMLVSAGCFFVGLYFTALWTFGDFAQDWQHMVAGPFLMLVSPVLFWLQYRSSS